MDSRRKIVFVNALWTLAVGAYQGVRALMTRSEFGPVNMMPQEEHINFYLHLAFAILFSFISLVLWILLLRTKDENDFY